LEGKPDCLPIHRCCACCHWLLAQRRRRSKKVLSTVFSFDVHSINISSKERLFAIILRVILHARTIDALHGRILDPIDIA
jgi:hypothetical protein